MLGGAGTVCGRAAGELIKDLRLAESLDILNNCALDLVQF